MSDESAGAHLDTNKWVLGLSRWPGQAPALFSDRNVTVGNGKLRLTVHREPVPPEYAARGYHD